MSSLSDFLSKIFVNALGSVKQPVDEVQISNPLHQFSSYTYAWSLWMLDVNDYNTLMSGNDAGDAVAWLPNNSYVVAEDSGLYPGRRLPTTLGLNYNITDVEIETVMGLNTSSKTSNMIAGTMTVKEPYGVTFIDSLIYAAQSGGSFYNYLDQPYMLQLDFFGYNDEGDPIEDSDIGKYRKRFPIKFSSVAVDVSTKGAEYKIDFFPIGHNAYRNPQSSVPKNITVVAGTVGEFFSNFADQLNSHWRLEVLERKIQYADSITFDIDNEISGSNIIYDRQMPITQANPNSKVIDLSKGSFTIPAGTLISDVINKVMIQSGFIIQQLGLDIIQNSAAAIPTDQQISTSLTQILNVWKTTVRAKYAGQDIGGELSDGVYDNYRNLFPTAYTYCIHQYARTTGVDHPVGPLFTDGRPYVIKEYNYIYTGQNIDILEFKLNFDTTWYTAVATYNSSFPSTNATSNSYVDNALNYLSQLLLGPQFLSKYGAGVSSVPNLTPLVYKSVVGDNRDTTGLNIMNSTSAQSAANMMKSIYSRAQGDMVALDLTIVGDPTLIKQDDWYYIPSPNRSGTYNAWDSVNQNTFANRFGDIRSDVGDLVVQITVNTPRDIDIEWTGTGTVFPQPGTIPSLFSGLYRILTVKNTFSGGKFTQVLSLVRVMNSDIVTNSTPAAANERPAPVTIFAREQTFQDPYEINDYTLDLFGDSTSTAGSDQVVNNTPVFGDEFGTFTFTGGDVLDTYDNDREDGTLET